MRSLRRYILSDKKLWKDFARYDSWITRFVIEGREYGGWYDAAGDKRLKQFRKHFPFVETVLELGCLEGGHTFELARIPGIERVVGLEGRDYNLDKARFILSLQDLDAIEFHKCDLERDAFSQFGSFDVVFSLGLLYHLEEPWVHLREVRRCAPHLFLWTHFAAGPAETTKGGYAGRNCPEFGYEDPLSGLGKSSFWPTLESLEKMILDAGFHSVTIVESQPDHRDGPSVTLAAS